MKKVTVPEEVKLEVQRADLECAARRDIITYIMEKNMAIPFDRMQAYQKEYNDKFFAFEQAKSRIEKEYVRPVVANPISWSLDYNTNVITIVEE